MFYDAERGHNNKPCVTYWVWMLPQRKTGVRWGRAGPHYLRLDQHPQLHE